MRLFFVGLAVLVLLFAGAWFATGAAWLGWGVGLGLALLVGVPVLRFVFWRGAPDDKFPWE